MWSYETYQAKNDRLAQWHRWFAWHPVWYQGVGFWLMSVERRQVDWVYPGERVWAYRDARPQAGRFDGGEK